MQKTFRFIGMALVAMMICVGFAACSDDDDEIGNVSDIYGTWETTHYECLEKVNGEVYAEWDEYPSESNNEFFMRYVFTEDGEVAIYYWSGSRWALDETCDYSISGNKLRIEDYDGDEDLVMTITTLSESVLVLEGTYSGTDGVEKYEDYEKLTLKKVD